MLIGVVGLAACSDDNTSIPRDRGATTAPSSTTSAAPSASKNRPKLNDRPALVAGGSFAGECAGFCRTELVLGSPGVSVELTAQTGEGTVTATVNGTLTADGEARFARVARNLGEIALERTYGYPDGSDGGAGWVELRQTNGSEERSTYDATSPPLELRDAHDLVTQVITSLRTCHSDELVTVDPGCDAPALR